MQYVSEVWFQNKELENTSGLHENTISVKPSSATKAIFAEFGRFSLIMKPKCQMIKKLEDS